MSQYCLAQDSMRSPYKYASLFPISLSPMSKHFTSHPNQFNPAIMHPTTFALTIFLLLPLAFAKAIPAPIASRDDGSTVVAYVSAYTGDNCDSPPINDLVIGFEASSENICVGNGTAAHGVYVRALHSGCVCMSIFIFICICCLYLLYLWYRTLWLEHNASVSP